MPSRTDVSIQRDDGFYAVLTVCVLLYKLWTTVVIKKLILLQIFLLEIKLVIISAFYYVFVY